MSADALGQAVADYGSVRFWVSGYALLGTTLAVLVRSVPIALAIGIAWPARSSTCCRTPGIPRGASSLGLLLEAFVAGGTSSVSATRAFLTVTAYVTVAAAVAGTAFSRRAVTA